MTAADHIPAGPDGTALGDFVTARLNDAERDGTLPQANIAAQRAILALVIDPYLHVAGDDTLHLPGIGGYGEAWIETALHLARAHADHPDFHPAWADR